MLDPSTNVVTAPELIFPPRVREGSGPGAWDVRQLSDYPHTKRVQGLISGSRFAKPLRIQLPFRCEGLCGRQERQEGREAGSVRGQAGEWLRFDLTQQFQTQFAPGLAFA